MKRGQISIEYIMILGAVLIITIPLFFYAIYETNYKIRLNQADDAVNTIVNAADTVYSMGPGSKKYVWVSIPSGVTTSLVQESTVQLTLGIFGGSSDIHASSKARELVGSIPQGQGTYRIAVESLEAGIVRIGSDYTDATKPTILRKFPDLEEDELQCPGLVTVGVETDEPAICKYFQDTTYETYQNQPWSVWEANAKDFEGRALTHYVTEYYSTGQHAYYVRCIDYAGQDMTDEGGPLHTVPTTNTLNLTFGVGVPCIGGAGVGGVYGPGGVCHEQAGEPDYDEPEVHLVSPEDEALVDSALVDFYYTANDVTSGLAYCVLNISRPGDPPTSFSTTYDYDPSEVDTNTINFVFGEKGPFVWNVFCVDDRCQAAPNKGYSETWTFEITKTFYESFLTSCQGWCGERGWDGGSCVQNPSQCNKIKPVGGTVCDVGECDDNTPCGEDPTPCGSYFCLMNPHTPLPECCCFNYP